MVQGRNNKINARINITTENYLSYNNNAQEFKSIKESICNTVIERSNR